MKYSALVPALFLVLACSGSKSNSLEIVYLESPTLEIWLGHTETEVLFAWGKPTKVKTLNKTKNVSYVISNNKVREAIEARPRKNWQNGPKTQGVDNDVLRSVSEAMKNSCFVQFSLDTSSTVISVQLTKFRSAAPCDISQIHKPKEQSVDA